MSIQKLKNNKLIIYKDKSGNFEIDVKIEKETVWLMQKQIAKLFGIKRPAITKHLNNIFKSGELKERKVCSNLEHTTKHGAIKGKTQTKKIKLYNLDAIISVGYRVNSKQATMFRIWATDKLKKYLIDGYIINQKKLIKQKNKFSELQSAIDFIEKKTENYLLHDKAKELMSLLKDYTKSLNLLKQYDENKIKLVKKTKPIYNITYKDCKQIIKQAQKELIESEKDLFGSEYKGKLDSIIGAINQTFDSIELYKSIEEKAANLFYLVIKDHPFADGNKRIASILFLYYLEKNSFLYKNYERKINNTAIVALALLVAVSDPKDKKVLVKIIISLLQ